MKKDIERVYLIDRYLKGELSGLTLDEFKNRLKTEPDFALEVETQKAIIEGIKLARKEELLALLRGQKTPVTVFQSNQPQDHRATDLTAIENEAANSSKHKNTNVYKMKPNFNNWFYAAVAVLLTPFIFYFVFIYFLKDNSENFSNNENTAEQITIIDSNNSKDKPEITKQEIEPQINDTSNTNNNEVAHNNQENIIVEKDKKIDEGNFSVANFQSINSVNNQEQSNNVSTQNGENSLGVNAIKKLNNTTVKVEFWQSVVNFNGYKLENNNLKLFGVKPEEKVNLKFLDNNLYIKKKDGYYKLNPSGEFEQYIKEVNRETIKILDSN